MRLSWIYNGPGYIIEKNVSDLNLIKTTNIRDHKKKKIVEVEEVLTKTGCSHIKSS